ncbi:MAG TPA: hypothetical protein LFV92_06965 [Rickettsia endosymbiont of Ceroptres masudai]|nr:hypothetical protein [Rickettsia endosymbiont of Ceroptres masudai]
MSFPQGIARVDEFHLCHPVVPPIVPDNFYYMSFPRKRESSTLKLF